MTQEFINQNYLIIENNIVTNVVVWNGDTNTWAPPVGSVALLQETTPARIWDEIVPETMPPTYHLVEVVGAGHVGCTWDGTVLTTNQEAPKLPEVQPDQPKSNGLQTI